MGACRFLAPGGSNGRLSLASPGGGPAPLCGAAFANRAAKANRYEYLANDLIQCALLG